MVNRVIVGAHYGLRDWLAQRVTAGIMAVYSIILAVVLLSSQPPECNLGEILACPDAATAAGCNCTVTSGEK